MKNAPHIVFKAIDELRLHPNNPRKVTRSQMSAAKKAIQEFGFNAPLLVDGEGQVISGHWKFEAAKALNLNQIPTLSIAHLDEAKVRALQIAENRQVELGKWDDIALAEEFQFLLAADMSLDLEATGFDLPEIEFRMDSIALASQSDEAEVFDEASLDTSAYAVEEGDLWQCGDHRLYCGSALEDLSYQVLLQGDGPIQAILSDPPYNVPIGGHVSGRSGTDQHREFAMASGEMSETEFDAFLATSFGTACAYLIDGGLAYIFMDHGHMGQLLNVGDALGLRLLNIPIWAKDVGGMGSFYRSQHEMVALFKKGQGRHKNRIQLGQYGRDRSNVWSYPAVRRIGKTEADGEEGQRGLGAIHPTVKPTALLKDVLLDCTDPGDVVLDPFGGSGSLILAAERTRRAARLIELDPDYVATALARFERFKGERAKLMSRSGQPADVIDPAMSGSSGPAAAQPSATGSGAPIADSKSVGSTDAGNIRAQLRS